MIPLKNILQQLQKKDFMTIHDNKNEKEIFGINNKDIEIFYGTKIACL